MALFLLKFVHYVTRQAPHVKKCYFYAFWHHLKVRAKKSYFYFCQEIVFFTYLKKNLFEIVHLSFLK